MKAKVPSYSCPISLEPERYWKEGMKEGREGGRRREGKGKEEKDGGRNSYGILMTSTYCHIHILFRI